MTDTSTPLNTHTAPFLDAITGPIHRSTSDATTSPTLQQPLEGDEPYTIKCICDFPDDDGSTVYCEGCETWQHIECYYSQKKVPEIHNCTDCDPRPLDTRSANERQRRRREKTDVNDRKPKRPQGKSHKKKVKVSEQGAAQVNGWAPSERHDASFLDERRSGSPKDQQPPAKRSKTSHRASSSISSHTGTPALAVDRRKRAESNPNHAQSPVKLSADQSPLNGYHNEPYSLEFMRLYEDDPGDIPMQANLFSTIGITSRLSFWISDREALAQATNGRTPHEVFHRLDQPVESLTFPGIQKQVRQDRSAVFSGRHPVWQYLTVDSYVPEGHVVGELKGQIGHMHDYCQDPINRWQTLRHPVPFVFFHPQLPIYIDTRNEGTRCRYVRRSCRPNLKMKTLLTEDGDFHFCFVATEALVPGTEITIGWVLDENIRKYLDRAHFGTRGDSSIKQEGLAEAEADYISLWVGKVLADFGGCACNSPQHCTLAQFDRRSSTSSIDCAFHLPNGKPKKPRHGLNNNSAISTGHATNSRACSEAVKYREEDDHDDSRSTSGSMHSKPRSRDMTPATRFSVDVSAAPGPELSDREKRKIAAAERTFEQLAQDHKIQKRKKRTSGGSNPNTPSIGTSVRAAKALQIVENFANRPCQKQLGHTVTSISQPNTPHLFSKTNHIDSTTSRRRSTSPISRPHNSISMGDQVPDDVSRRRDSLPSNTSLETRPARPEYVDSMMQTEPDNSDVWSNSSSTDIPKRRPYVSLTRRLLQRCHEDRVRLEQENTISGDGVSGTIESTSSMSLPVESPSTQPATLGLSPSQVKQLDHEDVEMKDADTGPAQSSTQSPPESTVEKPRPPDEGSNTIDSPSDNHTSIIKPPPPPWPSSASAVTDDSPLPSNGYRCMDLQVQLPPPPLFPSSTNSTPLVSGTPTSTANSLAQSPSSVVSHSYPPAFSPSVASVTQPSPVKKKLSLGDYMSRKSNKAEPSLVEKGHQAGSPTTTHVTAKPSTSLREQTNAQSSEESALVNSPRNEVHLEPMTIVKDPGG
ncbi:hypothetical protein MMC16_003902 [Acarospora aff. strigata]|nr:hypothetical protein [Acarospora aff. strigata]